MKVNLSPIMNLVLLRLIYCSLSPQTRMEFLVHTHAHSHIHTHTHCGFRIWKKPYDARDHRWIPIYQSNPNLPKPVTIDESQFTNRTNLEAKASLFHITQSPSGRDMQTIGKELEVNRVVNKALFVTKLCMCETQLYLINSAKAWYFKRNREHEHSI
jgi:hypothetical protein